MFVGIALTVHVAGFLVEKIAVSDALAQYCDELSPGSDRPDLATLEYRFRLIVLSLR